MRLGGASLAVVGGGPTTAEDLVSILEREGASVTACVLGVDDLERLSVPGFDAVLLSTKDDPGAFAPLLDALSSDPRTSHLPVVAIVDPKVTAARVARLAGAAFVPADPQGEAVIASLARVLSPATGAREASVSLHAARERIRKLAKRATTLRDDTGRFAHDVLALVNVVVGYGANLRDAIPGPLTPAQETHVARILEASADISALVERHASFAREAGDVSPDEEPISVRRPGDRRGLHDLARIVGSAVALLQHASGDKRIALTFAASAPEEIWCDAMQMKQVVTNLVTNALKLTPAGGRVHVEVRRRAPTTHEEGVAARAMVELVVADGGPGVPEAERARIFERGVRLDRDRETPGSGIGLAVVKDVVEGHGGTVRVEASAELGGAAFVVSLPVDRRQRQGQS